VPDIGKEQSQGKKEKVQVVAPGIDQVDRDACQYSHVCKVGFEPHIPEISLNRRSSKKMTLRSRESYQG